MDRRKMRIEAVRRHLHGESATSICRALGTSRRWFYYWIHRYSATDQAWWDDRSRAPLHQARTLSQSAERLADSYIEPLSSCVNTELVYCLS